MRFASLALALCASCAHFIVSPSEHEGRRVAWPPALRVDSNRCTECDVLRERLHARGVRTDLADAPLLSPLGLGSRRTTLTRAFGVPWALISLASLGLIPLRTARESFVEVQLADRARQRVTTVRRTFVTSYWIWLPLALSPAHRFSLAENNRVDHEVDREGLGRALDDALDELFSQ